MRSGCDLGRQHFSNKREELQAHLEQGEFNQDKAKIEAVHQARSAIQAMGFSESNLGHISRSEAQRGDGRMAIASFEPGTGRTNLGDIESIMGIAENIGQTVRQTTEEILMHEYRHKRFHEAEGAQQINQMIVDLFGDEAGHNLEEAAASLYTTHKFDAYQNERNAASGYAQKLGISLTSLSEIKLKGDYEKLAEHAVNSGIYPVENPANSNLYFTQEQKTSNSGLYKDAKQAA